MTIDTGPVFDMCKKQFDITADHLSIPQDERRRLLYPKRAVAVSCPIHRDDGSIAVFEGYRVQHHLTLGSTKGGVTADPSSLSLRELEALSRRYMVEMIPFVGTHIDVTAPDVGTNEQIMAWFMDTYSMYQGRTVAEIVTGKPVSAGGTEGRREATGLGVELLIARAFQHFRIDLRGSSAIVQGFGNVGSVAAASLSERGVKIVGVSDHSAAYHDERGFDVQDLLRHVGSAGRLAGFSTESVIDPEVLLTRRCDILVPAALERAITADGVKNLNCRILAEGANGPTTPEADLILEGRRDEIFVIPDILCNSGGVIVSYFEWVQGLQQLFWDKEQVLSRLFAILDKSFSQFIERATADRLPHRAAALAIGIERVRNAKATRGLFP